MERNKLLFAALLVAACGSVGETGAAGATGKAGAQSLVRLDTEAEGANCATGGIAIRSGVDVNEDGTLADTEATATRYVCNGVGTNGNDGTNGTNGTSGTNGTDGTSALVRLDDEPAGENCTFGGVAVRAGLDTNADGELSETEVTETRYVCDGFGVDENTTYYGSIELSGPNDALVLRGIQRITGDIRVRAWPTDVPFSLPSLLEIGGTFAVDFVEDAPGEIAFPALRTVGGDFIVKEASRVRSVRAPDLTTIEGDLSLRLLEGLEELDLTSLRTVKGELALARSTLVALALPALTTVEGGVRLRWNERLTSVNVPALASIGEYLDVWKNNELTTLSLPALATVGTWIVIEEHAKLATFSLPLLASVCAEDAGHCNFGCSDNVALVSLELPALASVDGHFEVDNNDALTTLALPALATVLGDLTVRGSAALTTISMPTLASADAIRVTQNPALTTLSAPALRTVTDEFRIDTNGQYPQCDAVALLDALTQDPTWWIVQNNAGTTCENVSNET